MKIAFCIEEAFNSGGMERVLAMIANALCERHEVAVITARQGKRPDYFQLDERITRVDFGITTKKKHIPLLYNPIKNEYQRRLSDYLCEHKFDIVVSLSSLEMYFLPRIKDGSKKVVWFHMAHDVFNLWSYAEYKGVVAKVAAAIQTRRRRRFASRFDKIVVLTKVDLEYWQKYCPQSCCIYNPITITDATDADLSSKQAIAVARLDRQKGLDYLIDAWAIVHKRFPEWTLNVWGKGPLKQELQNQIDARGLQDVFLLRGTTKDIGKEYAQSAFYVMSSRAEGLPLVLIEASAYGMPLVSYDCHYGPSDIIEDGKNGFLIPSVGDVNALADAICKMIENEAQRKEMGRNAKEMSKRFELQEIIKQWETLFKELLN